MSIYHTLGKTLLIVGISLGILTIFDYVIFIANNSGTLYVNPYEYIQYSVIALLIISGIMLIKKKQA
jgi:cytochrome c biogenesis protein CcdA